MDSKLRRNGQRGGGGQGAAGGGGEGGVAYAVNRNGAFPSVRTAYAVQNSPPEEG